MGYMLLAGSQVALAEEYLDCSLMGSTGGLSLAPSKVELEEAGSWYLLEDNKKIKDIEVSVSQNILSVSHTKTSGDQIVEYSYKFDDKECDSLQNGSATLTVKSIGALDSVKSNRPVEVTALYECTCAVD